MAIDLGTSNTTRYHSVPDHADFSLPDADWSWIVLARVAAGSNPKYLISTNPVGGANSFNLFIESGSHTLACQVNTGAVLQTGSSTLPLGTWIWMGVTRVSGFLTVKWIPVGGTSVTLSDAQPISGTSNGSLLYIGARN